MNEPIEILKELEKNNIEYVVLRGFEPIDKLNLSKDVDIYVPPKYKKTIHRFFIKKGWYTSKLNYTRYPHKQYIYLTNTGYKKIDIVFGLFYGNSLLHYKKEEDIIKTRLKRSNIFIPNPIFALETLLLHICFDKSYLSDHNYVNLLNVVKGIGENNNFLVEIANDILNNKDKQTIENYKKEIINLNILKKTKNSLYYILLFYVKGYLLSFLSRIRRNDFCIIGVDGSGKSSTISNLNKIFSDKIIVQYMGFKNYENLYIKNKIENKKNSILNKIYILILQWFDLIYRYNKNRFSKKVILFDRYPDEAIINFSCFAKAVAFFQYKIFFPHPKHIYYLYCSEETSFLRKDDINNKNDFIQKKKKFDRKYLNDKKVISISTDNLSEKEVVNLIINDFNEKYLKYFL